MAFKPCLRVKWLKISCSNIQLYAGINDKNVQLIHFSGKRKLFSATKCQEKIQNPKEGKRNRNFLFKVTKLDQAPDTKIDKQEFERAQVQPDD